MKSRPAILLALLAAVLYGISSPAAKLLLTEIPATLLAALLYLGAGSGMLIVNLIQRSRRRSRLSQEAGLSGKEWPLVAAMIALDIAAPVLLMLSLTLTSAADVSLLNNFEIAATALIALLFFHEAIGRRMWLAIVLITLASIILSLGEGGKLSLSPGSLLALLACACWGLENNITRKLSLKDPLQIVVIKGLGSGTGSLIIALALGQTSRNIAYMAIALALGFVAYGLSIYYYILAQRMLGAARTSAFYAVAPFIGALLAILIFGQDFNWQFITAAIVMMAGAGLAIAERHRHAHRHEPLTHEHRHSHNDGHHDHQHNGAIQAGVEHSHLHSHEEQQHSHAHTPDAHHDHKHS